MNKIQKEKMKMKKKRNLKLEDNDAFTNLPQDILLDILSRLPIKTISENARWVSKTWYNICVNNPRFAQLHYTKSLQTRSISALFRGRREQFHLIDHQLLDTFQTSVSAYPLEFRGFKENFSQCDKFRNSYEIVGFVNGLICFAPVSDDYFYPDPYYICNPVTNESLVLPKSPKNDIVPIASGFGFDSITNDYKVIRILPSSSKSRKYESSAEEEGENEVEEEDIGISENESEEKSENEVERVDIDISENESEEDSENEVEGVNIAISENESKESESESEEESENKVERVDIDIFENESEEESENEADDIESESQIEVYTLGSESWRVISTNNPYIRSMLSESAVLVNGCLHWISYKNNTGSSCSRIIVSFNVATEEFNTFELPPQLRSSEFCTLECLMVLGDCLGLSDGPLFGSKNIWVMKVYGVQDSWAREGTVKSKRDYWNLNASYEVIELRNGDLLLLFDHILHYYNLRNKTFKPIKILKNGSVERPIFIVASLLSPRNVGNHKH